MKRSPQDIEFIEEFLAYLDEQGIVLPYTVGYSAKDNDLREILFRKLFQKLVTSGGACQAVQGGTPDNDYKSLFFVLLPSGSGQILGYAGEYSPSAGEPQWTYPLSEATSSCYIDSMEIYEEKFLQSKRRFVPGTWFSLAVNLKSPSYSAHGLLYFNLFNPNEQDNLFPALL